MKNKIVKEKKKNYMTEIKDATIELIKPIFKKYGAITPDKAMLKEEVIEEPISEEATVSVENAAEEAPAVSTETTVVEEVTDTVKEENVETVKEENK